VLPGLVDVHVHGGLGATFNDPDPAVWRDLLAFHARSGSTTVAATVMSDNPGRMVAALATARDLATGAGPPPGLAGVHLEGPFLAPGQRGAHPAAALAAPDGPAWRLLAGHLDVVRLITLAPELPGAGAVVDECTRAGVVVAAGHSAATADDLAAAPGVRHLTHLWSGQSALRKDGPWRRPGLLEAALASDGLTAELIADGHHLPAALVRIAYRCLGPDRLCLVSDASAGTGLPVGSRFAMAGAEGVVAEGVAVTADGGSFCGSTSTLLDVLRFAVTGAGLPVAAAVRMATTTPARVLGLGGAVGAVAPGRAADVVVVDERWAPVAVLQRGEIVAGAGSGTEAGARA